MSKQEQITTQFLIQNGNNIYKHTQISGQQYFHINAKRNRLAKFALIRLLQKFPELRYLNDYLCPCLKLFCSGAWPWFWRQESHFFASYLNEYNGTGVLKWLP